MNNQDNLNGKVESSEEENKPSPKPVTPAKRTTTPRVARKAPVKSTTNIEAQKAPAKVPAAKAPVRRTRKTVVSTEDKVTIAQDNVITDLINKEEVISSSNDKEETKKSSTSKSAKKLKNKKKMITEKKQVKKTAKKVDELKDKLKKVKKKDAKKSVIKKVKTKLSDTEKTLKVKKAKLKKALKK